CCRMLGRALIQSARRVLVQQAKRRGHHDVPANPGPNCTYDMMPIPNQSYQKVHAELQGKFNTYLAVSLALLTASFGAAIYSNLWIYEELQPPRSWRERK
ncbi:hypothetical protein PFISCL1PPCAC_10769, partial [Pristionchus fissidentatus]